MRSTISTKLFAPLILVLAILWGFVYLVWLPSTTELSVKNASLQLETTLSSLSEGIVPLLLQGQLSSVYDTLNLVKQGNPSWIDLQVYDAGQRSLYPLFPGALPEPNDMLKILKQDIIVNGDIIGEIILVHDFTSSAQDFREKIGYLAWVFGFVFSSLILLLCLVLHRTIISPVKILTHAASVLKEGDYKAKLPIQHRDEIGLLAASFEESRAALLETRNDLVAARDEADAANAAKSEFLANMSHELRTPMTGVLGITDLLLEDSSSNSERKLLHAIHQSGTRLLSTLNDVLDISKIEAGGLELDVVEMDALRHFTDIVNLFQPIAEKKGIALSIEIPENLPVFNADSIKVCQIITNLVNNAIKFTSEGTVRIKADVHVNGRVGELSVQIIDTGKGISPSKCNKIFEKFSQEDMSITRTYGGTGLGLAICYELTQFMGGEIGVNSVQGKGSNFWIEVPVNFVDEAAAQLAKTEVTETKVRKNLNSLNVLVVEDDPINLMFAEKVFEKIGLSDFTIAKNGQEALQFCRSKEYDLVFMDCHMPVLDGYQATKAIRRQESIEAKSPVPIIALTANAMIGDREKCLNCGMNDVLTKPFNREKLDQVVTKWV